MESVDLKRELETMFPWSKEKWVETKHGPRLMRSFDPGETFWNLWRSRKDDLRALGVSPSKYEDSWTVNWWLPIPAEVAEEFERSRTESGAVDAEIDIPAPVGLDYLPFQRAGIRYAMKRPATLIGDEMGLGKTIQAIGVINADPSIRRVIVICPATLKSNWEIELRRWLVRDLSVTIATPKTVPQPDADIVIANYDILGKHPFADTEWDLAIVDECHYCKSEKTQRTKRAMAIAKKSRRRLFLTGTPIVNRPSELLPILVGIGGSIMDRIGSRGRYLWRYCGGTRTQYGCDVSGASNLDELQRLLRETCMVRRLKKDVLTELPAKRRQVIVIENGFGDVVRAEQDAAAQYAETTERLAAAVELAKAADDPAAYRAAVQSMGQAVRYAFEAIGSARRATARAKVPYVVEHLETILAESDDAKVVVFAHHHEVIDALRDAFGVRAVCIDGRLAPEKRQDVVSRFQNDPTVRVFIGGIQAAGVGITLTASSHVVFAELDWVPGNMTQAEDRCHRIGQQDSVLVQHIVLADSIDQRLATALIEKQEIIDRALDDPSALILKTEPVTWTATRPSTATVTRERIEAEAETLSPEISDAVLLGLRMLSGTCDGALRRDGTGFSKVDSMIGHELASQSSLTPRQAALGRRLLMKYRRTQLPEDVAARIWPDANSTSTD